MGTRNIAGTTSGNDIKLDNQVLATYSQDILFAAQPVLMFESVAVIKTDLATGPGSTIGFMLYNSLTGESAIPETTTITTETMSTSMRYIGVTEHARAIAVSQLLIKQALTTVLDDAAAILGQNYATNRDLSVRNAFYYGGVPYGVAPGAASVLYGQKANGDLAASRSEIGSGEGTNKGELNVTLLQEAVEQLATNKAPKVGGDAYVCFVHPHQAKTLRRDDGWLQPAMYADPARIWNGEIGRIEDIRFIQTTAIQIIRKATGSTGAYTSALWTDNSAETDRSGTARTFTSAAGDGAPYGSKVDSEFNTAGDVYRAILVGDNAVGIAESIPVEMRDNGVEDFGRKHSLAFYGCWGTGTLEQGHSLILETF